MTILDLDEGVMAARIFFSIPATALFIYLSIKITRWVFKVNETLEVLKEIRDSLKKEETEE